MRCALLLLAGVITEASPFGAPPSWRPIETASDSPYKLYVDIANVVRNGPARLFTAKMVPANPTDPADAAALASVMVKVKVDCSANTIETRSATMVDESGEAKDLSGNAPRRIKAGTDDMLLRKAVC